MNLTVVNQCGGCTACCEVESVPELGKPSYARCEHICGGGCSIYENRPRSCRDYQCAYLAGHLGGAKWRPDQCGLVVSLSSDANGYEVWLFEAVPHAADDLNRIKYLIEKLAGKIKKQPRAIRLQRYGTKIGVGNRFKVDTEKYPQDVDLEMMGNEFLPKGEMFECGKLLPLPGKS